jgi:hypothetical protein
MAMPDRRGFIGCCLFQGRIKVVFLHNLKHTKIEKGH